MKKKLVLKPSRIPVFISTTLEDFSKEIDKRPDLNYRSKNLVREAVDFKTRQIKRLLVIGKKELWFLNWKLPLPRLDGERYIWLRDKAGFMEIESVRELLFGRILKRAYPLYLRLLSFVQKLPVILNASFN